MKKLLTKRVNSFKNAGQGILLIIKSQVNMRIHIAVSGFVFLLAAYLKVSTIEWCFLVFAVVLVVAAEAFNTAIEYLGNAITKEQNKYVGAAKDISAAAVLINAVAASIVGIIIFVPYIIALYV